MASAIVPTTLTEAFATALELCSDDRGELEAWLRRCAHAGVTLEPTGIRESNANAIRALFGMELKSERAPWEN